MNTQTTNAPGVLSIVDKHIRLALDAHAQAVESILALPTIFDASEGISNRDRDYWGVSEGTVRRYRFVSSVVELDNADGYDLLSVYTLINRALDKAKIKSDDLREAIEDAETVTEAVRNIELLIESKVIEAEDKAEADAPEADAPEAPEATKDNVLNWLKSVAGPLGKVREAVVAGAVFTPEQAEAFDSVLSLVSGIAGQRAFVPAPEAVAV